MQDFEHTKQVDLVNARKLATEETERSQGNSKQLGKKMLQEEQSAKANPAE